MSATLANIDDLLKFLNAQFYEERFRPVLNKNISNLVFNFYLNIG
jgi:replicative superfamily II helicase